MNIYVMVYCRDHNKGKEEKATRDGKTKEEEKERTPEKEIKEKKKHSHSFMKRNKDAIPKVINFIAASCKFIKKKKKIKKIGPRILRTSYCLSLKLSLLYKNDRHIVLFRHLLHQ